MVAQSYNLGTQEPEAGNLEVQSHPQLYYKFVEYMNPYLKNNQILSLQHLWNLKFQKKKFKIISNFSKLKNGLSNVCLMGC